MYESFYGFREKPFHVTADPAFLYPSRQHQEALDHLEYGVRERLGFIVITGEVGTGKTTLAKTLVQRLQAPTRTALILNPALNGARLLQAILRDFGGQPTPLNRGQLLAAIERFLLEQAEKQATAVLIIDEAQALGAAALEQVRLLSTVETSKSKLLQIVLVGQPELDQRLQRDTRLRALRQRIVVEFQIQALQPEEVSAYIRHRLQVAGLQGEIPFSSGAMSQIIQQSKGIPRRINHLCDRLLLAGFVRETRHIEEALVAETLMAVPDFVTPMEVPHESHC